jgi:hypothetical protein
VRPPCRRREHWWRVAAQAALPAEPLQKRQENEPLRSRSLRLAKYPHITFRIATSNSRRARGGGCTILHKSLEHLLGRLDGPLHFRFVFQPLMAALLAIRDGRRDAHAGLKPFRVRADPAQRRQVMMSSWKSVGKVPVIALVIDAAYQAKVFRWFYPVQALIVATLLAIVPYSLLRVRSTGSHALGAIGWPLYQTDLEGPYVAHRDILWNR